MSLPAHMHMALWPHAYGHAGRQHLQMFVRICGATVELRDRTMTRPHRHKFPLKELFLTLTRSAQEHSCVSVEQFPFLFRVLR